MNPIGFQQPETVIIPGARYTHTEQPTRGGTDFQAGDELTYTISVDTRPNQYLDLHSLRFEGERLFATSTSANARSALVKGGLQNLISRFRLQPNRKEAIDCPDFNRLYNKLMPKIVDARNRHFREYTSGRLTAETYSSERDGAVVQWDGHDIINTPLDHVGPVSIMKLFAPTTRYIPTRMLEGATIDVILTLAPNRQVVLKKVMNDNEIADLPEPEYTLRGPRLVYELVMVNDETQAALADETADAGGIALNYFQPHFFTRLLPAASTLDHVQFTTLSRNFASMFLDAEPVFDANSVYYSDTPLQWSLQNSTVLSSGFSLMKDQFFNTLPLPAFGDGSYQFVIGDRPIPPTPREWKQQTFVTNQAFHPHTATAAYPARSYDDPRFFTATNANVFPLAESRVDMSVAKASSAVSQVFKALPVWPIEQDAGYTPAPAKLPHDGNEVIVKPGRTAYLTNRATQHTGNLDWRSDFCLAEYTSAFEPDTAGFINSGTDIDRVGGNIEVHLKRGAIEATTDYPFTYANLSSDTKFSAAYPPYDLQNGSTALSAAVGKSGTVNATKSRNISGTSSVVWAAAPAPFTTDPYVRLLTITTASGVTNAGATNFYLGCCINVLVGSDNYSGVIIGAVSGPGAGTTTTTSIIVPVRFALPPDTLPATASRDWNIDFAPQLQIPRTSTASPPTPVNIEYFGGGTSGNPTVLTTSTPGYYSFELSSVGGDGLYEDLIQDDQIRGMWIQFLQSEAAGGTHNIVGHVKVDAYEASTRRVYFYLDQVQSVVAATTWTWANPVMDTSAFTTANRSFWFAVLFENPGFGHPSLYNFTGANGVGTHAVSSKAFTNIRLNVWGVENRTLLWDELGNISVSR